MRRGARSGISNEPGVRVRTGRAGNSCCALAHTACLRLCLLSPNAAALPLATMINATAARRPPPQGGVCCNDLCECRMSWHPKSTTSKSMFQIAPPYCPGCGAPSTIRTASHRGPQRPQPNSRPCPNWRAGGRTRWPPVRFLCDGRLATAVLWPRDSAGTTAASAGTSTPNEGSSPTSFSISLSSMFPG